MNWIPLVIFIIIVIVITLVVVSIIHYMMANFKRKLEAETHTKIQEAYTEGHTSAVLELEKALGIISPKE